MLWYTVVLCITILFAFLGLSLRIKKIQIKKKTMVNQDISEKLCQMIYLKQQ